ncbi:4-hydroxy-3-methylbut-2-enyl diphosphate reductase [bacterium]|nr:4-hydroxy-3-methylbut-2-enyl diphosphate reductase [bacterium]
MEFILAETAGFCWGVRRALNKTLEVVVPAHGKVTTLGPLVHNPQVIDLLQHRSVATANDVAEVDGGLAIIRTHGVTPAVKADLEARADKVLDNTCPVVVRVQKLVEKYSERGYYVVIYGEPHHPEVVGLIGHVKNGNVMVIDGAGELDKVPRDQGQVLLVTQTTTNVGEWQRTMARAKEMFDEVVVKDTMCSATTERQTDILDLCGKVNAMVVIGGKNSGNTTRLAMIARDEFDLPTWHVESEDELLGVDFTPYDKIGVTAGASTPQWSIDRVMAYLKTLEADAKQPARAQVRRVMEMLVNTNIYTGLAAGALCYVGSLLQGVHFTAAAFGLVFCYVLSMHVVNRFTERNIEQFRDDPARVRFFEKYGTAMKILGAASGAAALGISIWMGVLPFLLVLSASVLGALYSVKIVPKGFKKFTGFQRLKDIAAGKNFFVASAWAIVSVFPLFFLESDAAVLPTIFTFAFLFAVTMGRSVMMDLLDMSSDRLVGRETIPLVLGEKKTKLYLRNLAAGVAAGLLVLGATGIFPTVAIVLAVWIGAQLAVFKYRQPRTEKISVVRRDVMVETHLIAAGALAMVWSLIF